MQGLTELGLDSWYQNKLDPAKLETHEVARVIAVHRDSYILNKGDTYAYAQLAGRLSYTSESITSLPTVGDWVYADFYDDDKHAVIHELLPRKTLIKRKTPGKSVEFQLIAANVTAAFIIQSMDRNFNVRRLERYLVMVYESKVNPIILLSKSDLISSDERDEKLTAVTEIAPGVVTIPFSNNSGENLQQIECLLEPRKTYCLMGSSGVGKTTLLNSIIGEHVFETQTVSKKESKGKHTTTHRELVTLSNGALFIDTPGMRELGNLSIDTGLDETFSDIVSLGELCKFANCSHTIEKGCAIQSSIESGDLSMSRYNNYLKMQDETAFNEMSYFEKRKKDKNFGKLIKKTIKSKNRW